MTKNNVISNNTEIVRVYLKHLSAYTTNHVNILLKVVDNLYQIFGIYKIRMSQCLNLSHYVNDSMYLFQSLIFLGNVLASILCPSC